MNHLRYAWVAFVWVSLLGTTVLGRSSRVWSEKDQGGALADVPNFQVLAKQVVPAVVSIQVEQRVRTNRSEGFRQRNPLREFFMPWGGELPKEFRNRGLGTGFVIDSSGLILTNNHVIEGADHIEVTFSRPDGSERKLEATLVGAAPNYDVALIKTKENAKASISYLGDSDASDIGSWVMAVGNPFGLSHSVSVGIISAKDRRQIAPSGRRGLYDFLQTDAAINPGNSGGPLVNMRGEVIGINTAINAAGSGIGFAIPINMVKAMLPDLYRKGKYVRSWLGIKIQPMLPELAQSYGLKEPRGALVAEVIPGSPASQSGVREGDIVLGFGKKHVNTSTDLPLFASMAGVGETVSLTLWRNGKQIRKNVTLAAFPEDPGQVVASADDKATHELGITVADISRALMNEYRLSSRHGVLIRNVTRGSAAARQGLQPGDVVVRLNGRPVTSARAFVNQVSTIKSGNFLRMQIQRPRGKLFLAVKKP